MEISRTWRRAKIDRFQAYMLDPAVVQRCIDWNPCVPSLVARKVLISRRAPDPSIVRAIFPYRRSLRGLPLEFSNFAAVWIPHLKAETGIDFSFVVSWSAGGRPLKSFFKEVGGDG